MAFRVGTTGNDDIDGTNRDDDFNLAQGGKDIAHGLKGDDLFRFEGTFTAQDRVDGGDDSDTLLLIGDYSTGVTFGAQSMVNVETLNLGDGFDYNFTLNDANVAAGIQFIVNGANLTAGSDLTFDGSHETDGSFFIQDGHGNDRLTGSHNSDTFFDTQGGNDRSYGGDGNDYWSVTRVNFTAADQIYGGDDEDSIELYFDAATGPLVLASNSMRSIETLYIDPGATFDLTMNDGNVGAGKTLTVNAGSLAAGQRLIFDGGDESNGQFSIFSGLGNDVITGSQSGNDVFTLSAGGNDAVHGGAGDNIFSLGNALNPKDLLDGGAGTDTLYLSGTYPNMIFHAHTIKDIEQIVLESDAAYKLTFANESVDGGATLSIDATAVFSSVVNINGSAENNGHYVFNGGIGGSIFAGGRQADTIQLLGGTNQITGGLGADVCTAGANIDTFVLHGVAESTGPHYDTIETLNFSFDKLNLDVGVSDTDADVSTGSLSKGSFNADLVAAIGSGQLQIGHAVLFDPDGGGLEARTFLIVDANGVAGYQADADYVFDVTDNVGTLTAATFTI